MSEDFLDDFLTVLVRVLMEDEDHEVLVVEVGADQVEHECAEGEVYLAFVLSVEVDDEFLVCVDFLVVCLVEVF